MRRTVEAAGELGIDVLTLYAFSADNWQRPPSEVRALMYLFEDFLSRERDRLVENDVRLNVIGRRDRLRPSIVSAIESSERATRACSSLLLRLAVDYSARWAIAAASRLGTLAAIGSVPDPVSDLNSRIERVTHSVAGVPPVDLLIRTSGEQRLSDFLLWESAYAELLFLPVLWPDFGPEQLASAVESFHNRNRRFGRLPALAS